MSRRKDREARLTSVLDGYKPEDGGLILYASTRRRVERFAELCKTIVGDDVVTYHAGLSDAERESAQTRFMSKEARIAVATNAFGMGIDRAIFEVSYTLIYHAPSKGITKRLAVPDATENPRGVCFSSIR